MVGVGLPGAVGSKVTCRPEPSTAVHWPLEGQATADSQLEPSIVVGVGSPGAVGSKVTCWPE